MTTDTDAKGRPLPETMTEREMLTEILLTMRQLADAIETVSKSPMLSAMGVRI